MLVAGSGKWVCGFCRKIAFFFYVELGLFPFELVFYSWREISSLFPCGLSFHFINRL